MLIVGQKYKRKFAGIETVMVIETVSNYTGIVVLRPLNGGKAMTVKQKEMKSPTWELVL